MSELIAALAVLALGSLTVLGAVGRLVSVSVPDADEYAGYLLGVAATFGAASAVRHKAFIRVELVASKLQGIPARALHVALLVAALGFLLVVLAGLGDFIVESARLGAHSLGVLETPVAIPQALVSTGLVFLVIELVRLIFSPVPAPEAGSGRRDDSVVAD